MRAQIIAGVMTTVVGAGGYWLWTEKPWNPCARAEQECRYGPAAGGLLCLPLINVVLEPTHPRASEICREVLDNIDVYRNEGPNALMQKIGMDGPSGGEASDASPELTVDGLKGEWFGPEDARQLRFSGRARNTGEVDITGAECTVRLVSGDSVDERAFVCDLAGIRARGSRKLGGSIHAGQTAKASAPLLALELKLSGSNGRERLVTFRARVPGSQTRAHFKLSP